VETAFITIPGHIYVAFSMRMDADEARKVSQRPDDLILRGRVAWVPIDVTQQEGGLVKAWAVGAKEWRENQVKNHAAFYPVQEAWQIYPPVAVRHDFQGLVLPSDEKIRDAFLAQTISLSH
jgi:hypothetical protein